MPIPTTDRIDRGTNDKYATTPSEMQVIIIIKACAINKKLTEFDNGREKRKPQISSAEFLMLADEDDENTHMEWETNQQLQKMPTKSLKVHWLVED